MVRETPLAGGSEGSEVLLRELAKYGIDADAGGYLYKRQVQLAQIVEQKISPLLESVGLPRAAVEHGGLNHLCRVGLHHPARR